MKSQLTSKQKSRLNLKHKPVYTFNDLKELLFGPLTKTLILIISVPFLISWIYSQYYLFLANKSYAWPSVTGTIVSSAVFECKIRSKYGGTQGYEYQIIYQYTVHNVSHFGNTVTLFGNDSSCKGTENKAHYFLEQYPAHSTTLVHYDPTSPDQSALRVGNASIESINEGINHSYIFFAILFIGLMCPLISADFDMIKSRRKIYNERQSITFEKVALRHRKMLFKWLAEPHMREFCDISQDYKDDIVNFINGRVTPSNYFDGLYTYWIGLIDKKPFCFIMTAPIDKNHPYPKGWRASLSKKGTTFRINFGIGDVSYLNKKLASPTLVLFVKFIQEKLASRADTFLIEIDRNNMHSMHVCSNAGFQFNKYLGVGEGALEEKESELMVKTLHQKK